jgi:hypothetical protein
MPMNNLVKNIKIELVSLKKESYFLLQKIEELENALVLVGNTPANGNKA